MVALLVVAVVAVSAGVILTTQMLEASHWGDPVAVPPQSSIQEATPGEPSLTRSLPSVFCNRDERPVDCVRWLQPLDFEEPPRVIPTPLGPLLHGAATLTLLEGDTGQLLWAQDLDRRDDAVVGIARFDGVPTIVLLRGLRFGVGAGFEFLHLDTGATLGSHSVVEPGGSIASFLVSDRAVHTQTIQFGPDQQPVSLAIGAWTPAGRVWEVEISDANGGDDLLWAHIEATTDTDVIIRIADGIIMLDAATGEERRRERTSGGHDIIDGDVGLRTDWDERDPDTRTLLADDLQTGQVLWTQELTGGEHWWLLRPGLVALTQPPQLVARDTGSGEVVWRTSFATGSEFVLDPYVPTDPFILADTSTQLLRGIAAATGEERWRFTSPSTLPSALHWFYPDDSHVAMRHRQRAGFVLLDRDTGQVVIDLRTDGQLLGEPWETDVRWPILQSSTGHLYVVSLDLPEATP